MSAEGEVLGNTAHRNSSAMSKKKEGVRGVFCCLLLRRGQGMLERGKQSGEEEFVYFLIIWTIFFFSCKGNPRLNSRR